MRPCPCQTASAPWHSARRRVAQRQLVCPKVSVAARSWAGLQPGFISFTPECQRNGERLCPCVARVNCRKNADIAVK